ncbi:NAD-dependent epimerase [Synechococcus sp. HJ21-Hayes]|uniref:NAD-dependent epimerase n=1 Tax=unclassified Synechococcus TaxID=2626047 RepID=UPI0020CF2391|nr:MULTISPECIES: NAD-dependent epimerase [unclassified Synechococcus]MCP9830064.1 NAD-dependent epimerase [Synechococcus sp. JJ3a-Johnson]MCP9852128.1 NAD-dependent epimerase [Synechococcus sp. HJ21-Hayes]
MTVLVTGAVGFIGYHLSTRLLERGTPVVGLDNLNPYYDPALKRSRLEQLETTATRTGTSFQLIEANLENQQAVNAAFVEHNPTQVVNLAAQAGVRYSIENPAAYIQANLVGFGHILESCRHHGIEHLVYASSSSVYGGNANLPFSEHQSVDHPVSLYAASKKANELMAHTYSHLYGLAATGLRFFTVYGPWGRPDMALFMFTKAMLEGRPIQVFNNGQMVRDFTYVDDIVDSLIRVLDKPAAPDPAFDPANPDPATSWAPHRVFNIGNSNPTPLMDYIEAIENALGIIAEKQFLPMQPGDVPATAADTSALEAWTGFKPNTPVAEGVARFVAWYQDFYGV